MLPKPLHTLLKSVRDSSSGQSILSGTYRSFRRRGLKLPERWYRHLPYHGLVEVPAGRNSFTIFSYGEVLENGLFWSGLHGYESATLHAWKSLAEHSRVVFDVGANAGLFSLLAGPSGGAIHAFEPVRRIADRLRKNVALNPGSNISIQQVAISDGVGTATLFDPGGTHCYSASLEEEFLPVWAGSEEVKTVTVDSYMKERNIETLDLMKIDVEGHEAAALMGARHTISEHHPSLLIELLPQADESVFSFLQGLELDGYEFYRIDEVAEGLRPGLYRTQSTKEGRNVLGLHVSRTPPSDLSILV